MSVIGAYIRSKFPLLYNAIVNAINKVISVSQPYSIYITDNLGGSFKSYFIENNMQDRLTLLKKNLDQNSVELIDILLERLLFYPESRYKTRVSRKSPIIGGLLPIETSNEKLAVRRTLQALQKKIHLPPKTIEESVFYFHHGLALLPKEVREYVRNQHFIDIGAFVGDSAIALREYQYSKIFSLEISLKSIARYKVNLHKNEISNEKYAVINVGVAASDNEPPVKLYDTGSAGLSLYRPKGNYDEIRVAKQTLDSIVAKNNIYPKFIKVDIEGAAMDFVAGAAVTLKNCRPVLSVAIYHNPVEFFEVKPALEKVLDDYTFLIRKLCSGVRNNLIHSEVVLLAYPNELMRKAQINVSTVDTPKLV